MKTWTKILAAITVGVLCTNSVPEFGMTADAETYEDMTYTLQDDGTIAITECNEEAVAVEIPAEIDGIAVTRIEESAFCHCQSLTSVTIPDSVTSIGDRAFYDTALYKNQPGPVYYADNWVVDSDLDITSAKIESNTRGIAEHSFSNCTALTSVVIPEGAAYIGYKAFYDCTSLSSIIIPESVTYFGEAAFRNTPWLTAKQEEDPFVVVNTVLIDGAACTGDIVIPEHVKSIGEYAFYYCNGITSVTIPDSVTNMETACFYNCENLVSAVIPSTITSIPWATFSLCQNLTTVTIPDRVTNIEDFAFDSCINLSDVYYSGTEAEWNAITIGSFNERLKNATIHFGNETDFLLGDVDFNGAIEPNDAYLCLLAYAKQSVGSDSGLTDAQTKAADVDGDGSITPNDAYYILLYYAKQSVGQDVVWEDIL